MCKTGDYCVFKNFRPITEIAEIELTNGSLLFLVYTLIVVYSYPLLQLSPTSYSYPLPPTATPYLLQH